MIINDFGHTLPTTWLQGKQYISHNIFISIIFN